MNHLFVSFLVYATISILTWVSPSSPGYESFIWKLFISQLIAIPVAAIIFIITYSLHKKRKQNKK